VKIIKAKMMLLPVKKKGIEKDNRKDTLKKI